MRVMFLAKPLVKFWAVLISLFLFSGNLPFFGQKSNFEGLFNQAKQAYIEGKYRNVIEGLETLISFLQSENSDKQLRGKACLLLAAAYEQRRDLNKAKLNYALALQTDTNLNIRDIDFTYMKEYQRIILNVQKTVELKTIEREGKKPSRKKRLTRLLLGVALAGIVLTGLYFLLKKKKSDNEISPNYDTEKMAIVWIRIPAGSFMIGDNFKEGNADELPTHMVTLDEYYISKHEITVKQFDTYLDPQSGYFSSSSGRRAHANVTWSEANQFCKWLSQKTGKKFLLPTEAQWERAARGDDQRRYPWGNDPPNCVIVNHCCGLSSGVVESFSAGNSPFDVCDMAGNVSEWCRDYYDANYYSVYPKTNPTGPGIISGEQVRVIRGGSYLCPANGMSVRASDRDFHPQNGSFPNIGFRIVMEK